MTRLPTIKSKFTCSVLIYSTIAIIVFVFYMEYRIQILRPLYVETVTIHYDDIKGENPRSPMPRCPDVNSGMMKGRWIPRHLTVHEQREITIFLQAIRGHRFGMPASMQRKDGKCGTLQYEDSHFRALCNPKGATPCCYAGRCVNKTTNQCRCPECYDLRSRVQAAYATWQPEDPRCKVKNYTVHEACRLLEGETIAVIGDSLMRHFYTALLLVLSNNAHDGALMENTPKDVHDRCVGMYTFTEKECRSYIIRGKSFCNGKVRVSYSGRPRYDSWKSVYSHFGSLIRNKRNATVIVGLGAHNNFDYKKVFKIFLYPVIQLKKTNATGVHPRLIWAATHKFALLKSPHNPAQVDSLYFNRNMSKLIGKYNIPIFDTYNLTSGASSPDGCHFGRAVNVMKIQMFLNFYLELLKKERKQSG